MTVLVCPQSKPKPRRAIVFGGRSFTDREWLFSVLDAQHAAEPFECIIEGGQVSIDPAEKGRAWEKRKKWGADFFARQWASARGVSVYTVKAEWTRLGRAAGPIRNQRMIDEYRATEGIGFPGGRGTADMLQKLKDSGLDWMTVARDRDGARSAETACPAPVLQDRQARAGTASPNIAQPGVKP